MSQIIHPNKDLTKPTKQKKPCKYCKECPPTHTQFMCFLNPRNSTDKRRTYIRNVSFKRADKEARAKRLWLSLNPADEYGQWDCYLGIHPMCLIKLDEYTIVQEHVKPKGRYPELRYDPKNRKAACEPCNGLKSGQSIETLIKKYPNSKLARDNNVLDNHA